MQRLGGDSAHNERMAYVPQRRTQSAANLRYNFWNVLQPTNTHLYLPEHHTDHCVWYCADGLGLRICTGLDGHLVVCTVAGEGQKSMRVGLSVRCLEN